MKKTRLLTTLLIVGLCMLFMPIFSYGANEDLVIVKNTEDEYIIYLKQYLEKDFKFAFSNNSAEDVSNLTFNNSALDEAEDGANNIAYVNNTNKAMFSNPTYMWVEVEGKLVISAREIDLEDNITKTELESVGTTSEIIPIKLEQEQTVNEVNEEGTKITETVGIVKVLKDISNGEYQLLRREFSNDTDNLFALAELIEKNDFTDTYTRIKASKEFYELSNDLYGTLNSEEWKEVNELKILQPIDAETGDQYILWVKGDNIQDVHFLTSYREYEEEYIKEQVTTVLPYTYDDNTILIALVIVIAAIVAVTIRIAILKKKEMMK